MNALLEPQCAPALPDFMMLDEEDPCADAWPTVGLASFAPVGGGCTAPVPIAASAGRRAFSSGNMVDSLESTQTLLGASLQDSPPPASPVQAQHAGSSTAAAAPHGMRFVPVPVSPAPQAYLFQQQPRYAHQYNTIAAPEPDLLYGGYGVLASPQPAYQQQMAAQHPSEQGWAPPCQAAPAASQYHAHAQYQEQQQGGRQAAAEQAAWELPPTSLPIPSPSHGGPTAAAHHAGGAGISSFDLQYGFTTQFGETIPAAVHATDDRMRRALSEEALQIGNYRGSSGCGAAAGLAAVHEGDNSEGSDADTLGDHHHPGHHPHQRLPMSYSAPSAGLMTLERSGSSRRPLLPHTALAGAQRPSLTASPRTICLKVKATARPRPPAAAARAAALTSGEAGMPRPARFAARRSVALSAAAVVAEGDEYITSDSDVEPAGSGGACDERRSGGGSSGGGAAQHGAAGAGATGKKKHNPWSLTETEGLVEGVRLLGPSKWAEIKKLAVGGIADLLTNRSAVDLKDKWRNLTRVAKLPKSVLKARAHKSTSDIPLELLLTVKDLMEMSRD